MKLHCDTTVALASRASLASSPLVIATLTALSACGGGNGGNGSESTTCPGASECAFAGDWSVFVDTFPRLSGPCGPIGLEGATLHFQRLAEENKEGVHSVVYRTSSSDIDLLSRAGPPDGMLDVVFNSRNQVLFETGQYYWREGDVTVDVGIDFDSPIGTWDADGFSVSWHIDVYEGDAIVVDNASSDGIDNDHDDQIDEADEEDEDAIDPFANLICEGTVRLTGSRAAGVQREAAPALYRAVLLISEEEAAFVPVQIIVDSRQPTARFLRQGPDGSRLIGDYRIREDGTFEGSFLTGSILGRVAPNRVLAEVVLPSEAGPSRHTTLEALRVEL